MTRPGRSEASIRAGGTQTTVRARGIPGPGRRRVAFRPSPPGLAPTSSARGEGARGAETIGHVEVRGRLPVAAGRGGLAGAVGERPAAQEPGIAVEDDLGFVELVDDPA